MRIRHLLLPLLFGLALVTVASAQSQDDPAGLSPDLNWQGISNLSLPEKTLATERYQLRRHRGSEWNLGNRTDGEPVCYLMRSYRVAREEPDSDVVEPAGFTLCEPNSRYSMKSTVRRGQIPSK
jgi:hypothetical protein